jgi:hypothetical protein
VADRLEQSPMVEPVNPFQRRILHGIEGPPRSASVDPPRPCLEVGPPR